MNKKLKVIQIKEFDQIYELYRSPDNNENLIDELLNTYKPNDKLLHLASLFLLSDAHNKLKKLNFHKNLLGYYNVHTYDTFSVKSKKTFSKIDDQSTSAIRKYFLENYSELITSYMRFTGLLPSNFKTKIIKNG